MIDESTQDKKSKLKDFKKELGNLKQELDRRFGHFMESKSKYPIFIVATFLDPRYKQLLSDDHKSTAMKYIKDKV